MMDMIVSTLPDAAAVRDHLVTRYGADRLWQVEQLSKHIFRAWLADGGVAIAIIQPDGSLEMRELEEVG